MQDYRQVLFLLFFKISFHSFIELFLKFNNLFTLIKLPRNYLLLLLVALSFSCSKEKPEPPTYYLTQDMYDYVIFPVGSWWVYKDSATGVYDTVKVISQERKINETDGDLDGNIDYKWEIFIQSKTKSFPQKHNENYFGSAPMQDSGYYSIRIEKAYCSGQTVIIYKSGALKNPPNKYEDINYVNFKDLILINNVGFDNVKIFKINRVKRGDGCDNDYDTTSKYDGLYYYSKNVGLVKKSYKDSLSWELINFHINK